MLPVADLTDPEEYQILGHWVLRRPTPQAQYHVVDLVSHPAGWAGDLLHNVDSLRGSISPSGLPVGSRSDGAEIVLQSMRALGVNLGPFMQNDLNISDNG